MVVVTLPRKLTVLPSEIVRVCLLLMSVLASKAWLLIYDCDLRRCRRRDFVRYSRGDSTNDVTAAACVESGVGPSRLSLCRTRVGVVEQLGRAYLRSCSAVTRRVIGRFDSDAKCHWVIA